ncbi:LysR substrate-binding domain-containing protein [Halomonas sp. ATCH28]|uniref:LysR substrate-binding domain-containing protein n=1 Tax=Halomonas gemina TaxID=2945105 RepID=A0ABT0T3P7_9GAMM|nr:LysR substrate-binding domain-containing protein [Halomonas gemina]MCL7941517.1 LysR substrate-binding domain-containing protein [Halomonas gemina]
MLNPRQLSLFQSIALTGSISAAARQLGISQPAASNMLGRLEEAVGFVLFKRMQGQLEITPEGSALLIEATHALDVLKNLETRAEQLVRLEHGTLTVGALGWVSTGVLPYVVADFMRAHPGLKVSLQTHPSTKVVDTVIAGHFDIGVVETPSPTPSLRISPFQVELIAVLPEGSDLMEANTLTPEQLNGVPLVTLDRSHPTTQRLLQNFNLVGAECHIVAESHLFSPALVMCQEGVGIAIVDEHTAKQHHVDPRRIKRLSPSIPFPVSVITAQHRPRSRLSHAFERLLMQHMATLSTSSETV